MTNGVHLYVEDCDAVYKRALDGGATSIMEPADQFYDDRSAGVCPVRRNESRDLCCVIHD